MGIALMKELTVRTKDYLVSFGERLSTRIFADYLKRIGKHARQVCLNSLFGFLSACEYLPSGVNS